ncbi:MAG TPA: hypothetical protein VK789_07675 [Bryobacteraceae bacterium]|nr:hypothetical protein [Bryobacteraceae bacterium]
MTIIIPHRTTPEKAIETIDHSWSRLFEGIGGAPIQLTDQTKNWSGRTMSFSVTARVGFIGVPISGTVSVDDVNVTVQCELPALVNKFIGEEKVRTGIEGKIRGMLSA